MGYPRERRKAVCIKLLFQRLQCIRNKKMLERFNVDGVLAVEQYNVACKPPFEIVSQADKLCGVTKLQS